MAASGVVTGTGNEGMAAAWDGPEGDHWADHADRYEATSARYGDLLLDGAGIGKDSAVLDIGCGTGATTIAAGRIATRSARVSPRVAGRA